MTPDKNYKLFLDSLDNWGVCPRQRAWTIRGYINAKLWGSANDLHLTTHFVTLTGQRIWHNQSNEKI